MDIASDHSIVLPFLAHRLRRASSHSLLSWMVRLPQLRFAPMDIASDHSIVSSFRAYVPRRVPGHSSIPFMDCAPDHSFVSRPWTLLIHSIVLSFCAFHGCCVWPQLCFAPMVSRLTASLLTCLCFFPSMPLSLIVSEYVFKQTMAHLND